MKAKDIKLVGIAPENIKTEKCGCIYTRYFSMGSFSWRGDVDLLCSAHFEELVKEHEKQKRKTYIRTKRKNN